MISPAHPPARFRGARAARSFIAIAAVLGGLALTCTVAGQAGAATSAGPARSASVPAVHTIPVNTANWTGSAGFGSRAPAWYVDQSGVVHLQGAAQQTSTTGTNPDLIGTLPPSARPATDLMTVVHTFNGTYADLAIAPDGTLNLIDPRSPMVKDYTFASLEGVTYRRLPHACPAARTAHPCGPPGSSRRGRPETGQRTRTAMPG